MIDPRIFSLRDITRPRANSIGLDRAIQRIRAITPSKLAPGDLVPNEALVKLREQLQRGKRLRIPFPEVINFPRREWLLLSLYLEDLHQEDQRAKLPIFSEEVAKSILGIAPEKIKPHIRRLATLLYFTHYDLERLPCLKWFADYLRGAWKNADEATSSDDAAIWRTNAEFLFHEDAAARVAEFWEPKMTVDDLLKEFAIPSGAAFEDKLKEALILTRLEQLPVGEEDESLFALAKMHRNSILPTGRFLGSKALSILVNRSKKDGLKLLPEKWAKQIPEFGCDPRVTNAELRQKWWWWASSEDIKMVVRSLTHLTIGAFIALLEQSLRGVADHQFPRRRDFLLQLFDSGRIERARLILTSDVYMRLSPSVRTSIQPLQISAKGNQSSFICLQCTDDVYLIEGTHNFAMRGFVGERCFPLPEIWDAPTGKRYEDHQFRVAQGICQIYQIHHTGDWVEDVRYQLRHRGIEWRDLE